MIMSSYKLVAFSSRKLCRGSLLEQIDTIAEKKKPDMLVLREKDLSEDEYEVLARKVIKKCEEHGIECILHNFIDVAIKINYKKIHLPLKVLKDNRDKIEFFEKIGVSTHSVEEAVLAERLGADYITAGHVFETDCKKGLKPRGVEFLNKVCNSVHIDVYALGGINEENMDEALRAGADGVCLMSGLMRM